jgi:hypothetical protein
MSNRFFPINFEMDFEAGNPRVTFRYNLHKNAHTGRSASAPNASFLRAADDDALQQAAFPQNDRRLLFSIDELSVRQARAVFQQNLIFFARRSEFSENVNTRLTFFVSLRRLSCPLGG